MAESDCRAQVNACAMRISLLASNGAPLVGASNAYVTNALVTLAWSSVYTDGEEIEEKNACGATAISYRSRDTFTRGDVTITLVSPDPFASALLSGGSTLTVAARPLGFAAPPIGPVTGNGISIELWAARVLDGTDDPDYPYAHWAYPKITNLRTGDHEHGNSAIKPVFSGQAYQNPNWGNGPINDFLAASNRAFQWIPSATIPTPTCALIPVLADA